MRFLAPIIALAVILGGCAKRPAPATASVTVEAPSASDSEWRRAIAPDDTRALDTLPATWAYAGARVGTRARADVKAEGALLEPGAALDHPALPPGSYNCRVIRLGAVAGRRGMLAFPSQFCFVTGGDEGKLSLDKQTGNDLPTGWLYPDGDKRYVFLGAQQRKPGDNSVRYGIERSRDLAGIVERVGPFRWRLVIPRNDPDGLWIYELTPVPAEQQPGADPATKIGSSAAKASAG